MPLYVKHPGNPVVANGATYDSAVCGDPDVLFDGTTYHMFYTGLTASDGTAGICHATASNPLGPWTKDAANPVIPHGSSGAWDYPYVHKPRLAFDGSAWWCFYFGYKLDLSVVGFGLASATSLNGPWTKHGGNPFMVADRSFENGWIDGPTPMFDGSTWRLYYACDRIPSGEPKYWALATAATFPTAWTKRSSTILAPAGTPDWAALSVGGPGVEVGDDGLFHCYFNGFDGAERSRIGHLTSADGIAWDLTRAELLIGLGGAGAWDRTHVYRACHRTFGGTEYIYYNGATAPGADEQVGVAVGVIPATAPGGLGRLL